MGILNLTQFHLHISIIINCISPYRCMFTWIPKRVYSFPSFSSWDTYIVISMHIWKPDTLWLKRWSNKAESWWELAIQNKGLMSVPTMNLYIGRSVCTRTNSTIIITDPTWSANQKQNISGQCCSCIELSARLFAKLISTFLEQVWKSISQI